MWQDGINPYREGFSHGGMTTPSPLASWTVGSPLTSWMGGGSPLTSWMGGESFDMLDWGESFDILDGGSPLTSWTGGVL